MPELSFYERQHIQKILLQQGSVGSIFNEFAREASMYLRKWADTGKPNVWVRNAGVEKGIDRALASLQKNLLDNIADFGMDAWKRSQAKNDEMVNRYLRGMAISSTVKEGLFFRNMEALKAMQKRTDEGMGLSDRVWDIVDITRDQVELFLGSGLSVGRSASEISGDVRQLLRKPDKRFRRVRDENGKLRMSTPMQNYHPGQGVYRSGYMNALRLTSTETNINYRQADHDRWKKMDFVLGVEIKRSANNKGPCKVCDALVGEYPRGFLFTGAHPFCVCLCVPILMDHGDFADYLLDGTMPSGKVVTGIPAGARDLFRNNHAFLKDSYVFRNNKPYFTPGEKGI